MSRSTGCAAILDDMAPDVDPALRARIRAAGRILPYLKSTNERVDLLAAVVWPTDSRLVETFDEKTSELELEQQVTFRSG